MKFTDNLQGRWQRLGVSRQLALAFGLLVLLASALGAGALLALSRVDQQAEQLSSRWLAGLVLTSQARASVIEMRDMEVKHSRSTDASYHGEYEEKMTAAAKVMSQALTDYRALPGEASTATTLAAVEKAWAQYQKFSAVVVKNGRDKQQTDAADISDGAAAMAFDETVGALGKLAQANVEGGHAAAQEARATDRQAQAFVAVLLGLTVVLGGALALFITRGLMRQLGGEPHAAAALARAVAEGDLSTPVVVKPGDATSLMASLQRMQQGLADAVRQVREGSESVATASSQIADGNQDLSGRTEQQASALQQTAATMEELGTTVRHNADNARKADELARGASTVAERGGSVVGQVVATMKGINDSSRKISDIIAVIDGIAFQTNILALNAAVEAARAGEQGRGFAVVAGEVRTLAQRSAEAAKEIKSLINASVERVEQGTGLVDEAGRTMEEIVAAIGRVSAIVGEISSASSEQSNGVGQVTQAVSQMDQATQQNAALVEESAAAAESLRQQAQQLVQAVAVFRLA
jgi:methyl-accepting chemotaxis protein